MRGASFKAATIERMAPLEGEWGPRVVAAESDAMAVLAAANRLDVFESTTQQLAAVCVSLELPQPARAAAYAALVGLNASDLLPHSTFRVLHGAWESGLGGLGGSSAVLRGEEVLLHIE